MRASRWLRLALVAVSGAIPYAVACGHFSSTDGGDSDGSAPPSTGDASSTAPTGDAVAAAPTSFLIDCYNDAEPCVGPREVCCRHLAGPLDQCSDPHACSPQDHEAPVECDGVHPCLSGVCCFDVPNPNGITSRCAPSCARPQQLGCNLASSQDCPDAEPCTRASPTSIYGVCGTRDD
jgi:hypothetical protein